MTQFNVSSTRIGVEYRRIRGRDTWHFHPRCQHYRRRPIEDYIISDAKPSYGELCNECQSKQRRLEERLK
jgi:hypothetical protein